MRYYHIHKMSNSSLPWENIGEYLISRERYNNYYNYILDQLTTNKGYRNRLLNHIDKVSRDCNNDDFQLSNDFKDKFIIVNAKRIDLIGAINITRESLFNYLRWIQEEIFEKTRAEKFQNLPSRKYCLWLCRYDELNKWLTIFKSVDKIIELEIDGIIHEADAGFVLPETYNITEFEQNAIDYWSGVKKDQSELEILFEGKIKVIKIYNTFEEIIN